MNNSHPKLVALKTLGHRIAQARGGKRLSQRDLGKLISYTQVGISQIERGLRNPSLDVLIKLSIVLEAPVEYLLFGAAK